MTVAYPLQWPDGKPRKQYPDRSRFGERSIDASTQILVKELQRLGAINMVLSTNLRLRNDGLPYSNQAQPKDQGVAVYFVYKKQSMCFACDRWDRIQDNIYAVAMTIDALRSIERWGSGDMVQQAFSGFTALPAPSFKRGWWEILDVQREAQEDTVKRQYRMLAHEYHPDRNGGNNGKMSELNAAYDEYKNLRGIK